jgi:hypothetical protein
LSPIFERFNVRTRLRIPGSRSFHANREGIFLVVALSSMYEQFSHPSRKARKRNIVNKTLSVIAMALALLMTVAANAQTIHMKVQVPFNFIAAGTALPAGQYEIVSVGIGENVLAIRNVNSPAGVLVISHSCESLNASSNTKIVFHRYGNRNFLAEVWVQGDNLGHQVTPTSRETELALDFPKTNVELLLARR